MVLEDLVILRDLGIGLVSLVIVFVLGKTVSQNAFKQIDAANDQLKQSNKRGEEIYDRFIDFIEKSYEVNSQSIGKLCVLISEDMELKEKKLKIIEEYQEMFRDELHVRHSGYNKNVPKEYRK